MPTLDDLPSVPGAPVVGNALQFRRDRLGFLRDSAEYGDAVRFRIGPVDAVLMSHPDAVRDLLAARQRDFRKGPVLQRARAVLGEGLLTSEGDVHRHDRRLLQAAFHPRRVRQYADEMRRVARAMVREWEPGMPIDVHAETVRTTLTVAGRTLFGSQLDKDVDAVSGALHDVLSAYGVMMLPLGRHLLRLPPTRQRLTRGMATLGQLTDRVIAHRPESDGGQPGSILALLATENDADKVRNQVLTLLLAGHETTANALAFACHLLAADDLVQDVVAQEVLSVCGVGGEATVDDLERLPSVRAAIAEALRLYPPSWAMGRESVRPTEVAGVRLPAGAVVIVSQWVVHRDARWWPEPEHFDPRRFLDGDAGRTRTAYFPFGGGSRQCIGEGFAWTEGVLTLAAILASWRLRPAHGRALTLEPLLTLRPRDGVWVVPEVRR